MNETKKHSKFYKYCAVPLCYNTTIKTPQKLFVHIPVNDVKRKQWSRLARREKPLIAQHAYFCEDHFDMPNDMENYMQYHIMGSVTQIRMKRECLPSKFHCQYDVNHISKINKERAAKKNKKLQKDCLKYKNQYQSSDDVQRDSPSEEAPCNVKACRVCFQTDRNMFPLVAHKMLYTAYETLTGLLLEHEDHLPQYVCEECGLQLLRWDRFRARTLRAHLTLLELTKNHGCITEELMESVRIIQSLPNDNEYGDQIDDDLEIELSKGEHIDTPQTDKDSQSYKCRHKKLRSNQNVKTGNDKFSKSGSLNNKRGRRANNVTCKHTYSSCKDIVISDIEGKTEDTQFHFVDVDESNNAVGSVCDKPESVLVDRIKDESDDDAHDDDQPTAKDITSDEVLISRLHEDVNDIKSDSEGIDTEKFINTGDIDTKEYKEHNLYWTKNKSTTANKEHADADMENIEAKKHKNYTDAALVSVLTLIKQGTSIYRMSRLCSIPQTTLRNKRNCVYNNLY